MIDNTSQSLKVFISYSWDSDKHKDDVLKLADRLLADGIDCNLDQYEVSPPEGWPHWMRNQVDQSDFVLVVCTEQYKRRFQGKEEFGKGKGVTWEGAIINQLIYDQVSNTKFIPVIFSPQQDSYIPTELRRFTYYSLNTENLDSDRGYENLYRHLTKQPLNKKPKLGKLRSLPPRQRQQFEYREEQNNQEMGFDSKLTELYDRVRRLHRARQWKQVIAIFQQMQEENLPYVDPDGLYRLARNELSKEQQQREQVQREREQKNRELENLYNQGARDFKDKNWQEAKRKFEAILQREPSDRNLERQAQEKLTQVQEKLEWENRLSIGLIVICWLFSGLIGSVAPISGAFSGLVIWWASQRTKQKVLQLVLFFFIGGVAGCVLGLIIEKMFDFAGASTYRSWMIAIMGGAITVSVMFWQRQR
jgi:hypothetical protein